MSKFPPTLKSKGQGTGVTFGTLAFACRRVCPLVYTTIAAIKELESYATNLYTVKLTADFLAKAGGSPASRRVAQRLISNRYTDFVPEC